MCMSRAQVRVHMQWRFHLVSVMSGGCMKWYHHTCLPLPWHRVISPSAFLHTENGNLRSTASPNPFKLHVCSLPPNSSSTPTRTLIIIIFIVVSLRITSNVLPNFSHHCHTHLNVSINFNFNSN